MAAGGLAPLEPRHDLERAQDLADGLELKVKLTSWRRCSWPSPVQRPFSVVDSMELLARYEPGAHSPRDRRCWAGCRRKRPSGLKEFQSLGAVPGQDATED